MNLLLAAVLLMQDKTAEETFKKIEEVFLKARTLSIKCELQGSEGADGREEKFEVSGEITLKEPNRVMILLKPAGGQVGEGMDVRADGLKMAWVVDRKRGEAEVWSDLTVRIKTGILRAGAISLGPILSLPAPGLLKTKPKELGEIFQISDFTEVKDGTNGVAVGYSLKSAEHEETFAATLWYDPKTYKPIKRVATVRTKDGFSGKFVETYGSVTVDLDIPDEKFKLPEEKK